jgi:SH3 domain protein
MFKHGPRPYRILLVFSALGLCLTAQTCWSEKAYMTNPSKINLRTGPSTTDKIVAMLQMDQPVEVLETKAGWSHVRLLDQAGGNLEGWVPSQFLIARVPWNLQANSLREENTRVKEKLARIEKEWQELSRVKEKLATELQRNADALDKLQKEYDTLKRGAADYLELKENHEFSKAELETASKKLLSLTRENEALSSSEKSKWLGIGASVLLIGLLLGLIMGRQTRRRSSSYY